MVHSYMAEWRDPLTRSDGKGRRQWLWQRPSFYPLAGHTLDENTFNMKKVFLESSIVVYIKTTSGTTQYDYVMNECA